MTEHLKSEQTETHTKLTVIRRILSDTRTCAGFDADSLTGLLNDVDNHIRRIERMRIQRD